MEPDFRRLHTPLRQPRSFPSWSIKSQGKHSLSLNFSSVTMDGSSTISIDFALARIESRMVEINFGRKDQETKQQT